MEPTPDATPPIAVRAAKIALLAAIALYFTLVAVNNLIDFDSNYEMVRHVLLMDSTFAGNHAMGRAIAAPRIHLAFYVGIIAWEAVNAILGWWGTIRLARVLHSNAAEFQHAKSLGVVALASGMLLWLVAFLTIGGEWFLMWQSKLWNGQDAAFRMFACEGIVLVILLLHDEA